MKRFYIVPLLLHLLGASRAESSPCDGWLAYQDEKCFKLVEFRPVTQPEVEAICRRHSSEAVPALIRSRAEQELIAQYIRSFNILDNNVWIGVKRMDGSFRQWDRSGLTFANWAPNRPLNRAGYECGVMSADETNHGQWLDEKCQRRNLALCQVNQTWTLDRMQRIFIETRKLFADKLNDHQDQLGQLQTGMGQLQVVKDNPVPIGFIYMQLPNQPRPDLLWPRLQWKDISPQYAGLFFRVYGGNSSAFEVLQEQSSPRLVSVSSAILNGQPGVWSARVPTGEWSENLFTGAFAGSDVGTKFMVSDEEVRPRNHAIKVWTRIR